MKCIYCGCLDSKVVDSRQNEEGTSIRRRRECIGCGKRFTTYETIENTPVLVVKKDGSRQIFDINKVKLGIMKSCEKRPISMSAIDKLLTDIQRKILNSLEQEVSSTQIGELVMEGLKDVDDVAYVRYASVHRQFKDINTLLNEIEELVKLKDSLASYEQNKKNNKPE
ncbi:MAG: transcriptional repressor NrdR [Clostridia bacterium]|nr:transcriptional repressor NrdR [Clostridia bacterium]MBO7151681.1 transcriptional repressor NrdR [Clostridia bacterium]MBR5174255.1 transcriptional repressor NrdR [Clostridia bacterium]